MRFDYIKKFLLISGAALSVSIISVQNLQAQGGTPSGTSGGATGEIPLLQAIANNTNGILQQVNNLQSILTAIGQLALAWLTPDTSDVTSSQLVPNFTSLGSLLNADLAQQISMQSSVNNVLLPSSSVSTSTVPYANDLLYTTLLGQKYFSKDPRQPPPDSAMNYILNASGANIVHTIPGLNWQGSSDDQTRYQNYYNTAIATESYNAYVLSSQYADKSQFNTMQTTLITQASDQQNWMAKVASENIGWVLRQLLLFQSQSFVLLTQLVQSEKQIATASVMTNALILTLNQEWEENFVSKAQGVKMTN